MSVSSVMLVIGKAGYVGGQYDRLCIVSVIFAIVSFGVVGYAECR